LRQNEGENVSGWIVCRILKQPGLTSRLKQKKPRLIEKNMKDHLEANFFYWKAHERLFKFCKEALIMEYERFEEGHFLKWKKKFISIPMSNWVHGG